MKKYLIERKKCPICGSVKNNIIYSLEYSHKDIKKFIKQKYGIKVFMMIKSEKYILAKCKKCNFIYQKFIPNAILTDKIYNLSTQEKQILMSRVLSRSLLQNIFQLEDILRFIKYLNKKPKDCIFLDYGSGYSSFAVIAQALGCNIFVVEISKKRKQYIQKYNIKVISEPEVYKKHYDFINLEQILEHVPEPKSLLHKLAKALKPNGLLRISVPNGKKIKKINFKKNNLFSPESNIKLVSPLAHLNCFNSLNLRNLAKTTGLISKKLPCSKQIIICDQLWNPLNYLGKVLKIFIKRFWDSTTDRYFIKKNN